MSSNKSAKKALIEIYGEECFIEKLHLRKGGYTEKYKSKGQYKKMKQQIKNNHHEKNNLDHSYGTGKCLYRYLR